MSNSWRLNSDSKTVHGYFKNSYKLIAPSDFLARNFIEAGYNVEVIPNNIPIANYIFNERKDIKPNILWVRAFNKLYNPLLAIELLEKLVDDRNKLMLI